MRCSIGIAIKSEDATFTHFLQYVDDKEYLYSFYTAESWGGEPEIKESEKCDDLQWFPLAGLPENMTPVTKLLVEKYKAGEMYTEFVPQA